MKPNIGSLDRTLRILAAVVIIALYFTHVVTGTMGLVLLVVAAILILTATVSFCPIYAPFKFNTIKK